MGALPEEDEEEEGEDQDEREGEGSLTTSSAMGAGSGARVSPPLPLELGLEGQHDGGAVERKGDAETGTSSVSFGAGVEAGKTMVGRGEEAARMEEEGLGGKGVG